MTDVLVNVGKGSQWITVPDEQPETEVTGDWTEQEDFLLERLYCRYGPSFVARALGRGESSTSGRAFYLGLKGPKWQLALGPRPDTLGRVA